MAGVTMEDVQRLYDDPLLDEIYCLTFVRGVDEREALRRMGALEDTLRPRTLSEAGDAMESFEEGCPGIALAIRLGDWTVVFEPGGFEGADIPLLAAVSRGSEAVTVLRHDYASDFFGYAVDGEVVTSFNPDLPQDRWGADPDRLLDVMRAVGLRIDEDDFEFPATEALALAARITGVLPEPGALDGPLPSAQIESWFSQAAPTAKPPRDDPELVRAVEAAAPELRRSVAAQELQRLATVIGVSAVPGLAEVFAAVRNGQPVEIPASGELGRHVRAWLQESKRAGWSGVGSWHRGRMTDEERLRAFLGGWFAEALRAGLSGDSVTTVFAALRPLLSGPDVLREPGRRDAVLAVLRDR